MPAICLLHAALSQVLVVYMGERDDGSAITGRFRIQQVTMRFAKINNL